MRNRLGNALATLALSAGAIGLNGCTRPDVSYEVGEVTKISGHLAETLVSSPEWDGMVSYSNETVKIGSPPIVLNVDVPRGRDYVIQIGSDDDPAFPGQQTVYNLMSNMKVGSKVRFAVSAGEGWVNKDDPDEEGSGGSAYHARDYFNSDRLGVLDPDAITIIGN